jgi:hypothetical protein
MKVFRTDYGYRLDPQKTLFFSRQMDDSCFLHQGDDERVVDHQSVAYPVVLAIDYRQVGKGPDTDSHPSGICFDSTAGKR